MSWSITKDGPLNFLLSFPLSQTPQTLHDHLCSEYSLSSYCPTPLSHRSSMSSIHVGPALIAIGILLLSYSLVGVLIARRNCCCFLTNQPLVVKLRKHAQVTRLYVLIIIQNKETTMLLPSKHRTSTARMCGFTFGGPTLAQRIPSTSAMPRVI